LRLGDDESLSHVNGEKGSVVPRIWAEQKVKRRGPGVVNDEKGNGVAYGRIAAYPIKVKRGEKITSGHSLK